MKIMFRLHNGKWYIIYYDQFSVGSADDEYPLTVGAEGYNDVIHWLASHQLNGMKFSTPDNNNDAASGNYAAQWKGGWWYNNCTDINLNTKVSHIGDHCVLYAEIIIRPKDCIIN